MAMTTCKDCKVQISTHAKLCPNCGRPNKVKKEWKDMPLYQKIFVVIMFSIIALIVIGSTLKKEERLYSEVSQLEESQYQEKYEGYLELYNINNEHPEYKNKAITNAKAYLKTLPVTEPQKNLSVYKDLAELDTDTDYTSKIDLYKFMRSAEVDCAIAAQQISKDSLNNKSTYDSKLGSYGEWVDKITFRYRDKFEAANSFGVVSEYAALYLCEVNHETERYSIERLAITKQ